MDKLNVLDVIRYENYRKYYDHAPKFILKYVVDMIISKSNSYELKTHCKTASGLISISYNLNPKFNRDLIKTPYKIEKGSWTSEEVDWIVEMINGMSILETSYFFKNGYTITHPKEAFYMFSEIVCHKFGDDENLMIILDDVYKKYIK